MESGGRLRLLQDRKVLRISKLYAGNHETHWLTAAGGLFIEPIQRPDARDETVSVSVTLSAADYKVLGVLHDDVASYIGRLVTTHCKGLVKSAVINDERKRQQNADKK